MSIINIENIYNDTIDKINEEGLDHLKTAEQHIKNIYKETP